MWSRSRQEISRSFVPPHFVSPPCAPLCRTRTSEYSVPRFTKTDKVGDKEGETKWADKVRGKVVDKCFSSLPLSKFRSGTSGTSEVFDLKLAMSLPIR